MKFNVYKEVQENNLNLFFFFEVAIMKENNSLINKAFLTCEFFKYGLH